MKKLNKKGFTLVELLAVVVILLAISVIAVTSISAAIERNKEKQNESKIEIIISYAKLYYDEHKNSLGSSGNIELSVLNLSENEMLDSNDEYFTGCVCYESSGSDFWYEEDGECSS